MSTTTSPPATIRFTKTRDGEWVAVGPADAMDVGPVTITKAKGGTVERTIERLGKPFDKGGVRVVYGYLADDRTAAPAPAADDKPSFPPTAEQQAAIDLFLSGVSLKVTAVAGAGKTSTLKMMADRVPGKRGIFTAFNKAIVVDATAKFAANRNVRVATAHALAWSGTPTEMKDRFNTCKGERQPPYMAARHLGIDSPFAVQVDAGEGLTKTKMLGPDKLANWVLAAVRKFCQSGNPELTVDHFPYFEGVDVPDGYGRKQWANNRVLRNEFIGVARRAWTDLSHPAGSLHYGFDHYLKQFALRRPDLGVDYLMVDEAQDLSGVTMSIVEAQLDHGHQVVLVGDSMQAINGFIGCVDALSSDLIEAETALTKSWRFGPAIADAANRVLDILDGPVRVSGNENIPSTVGSIERPKCFLARTNAGAIRRLFEELDAGGRPRLIGATDDITSFCRGAHALIEFGSTTHGDLAWASSWGEVQEYVKDEQGADLKLMVDLIDEYGAMTIVDALERMPAEKDATLICATAHKVKGREWDTVQLGDDFPSGKDSDGRPIDVSDDEAMLTYVAITRARYAVDFTRVGWLS